MLIVRHTEVLKILKEKGKSKVRVEGPGGQGKFSNAANQGEKWASAWFPPMSWLLRDCQAEG